MRGGKDERFRGRTRMLKKLKMLGGAIVAAALMAAPAQAATVIDFQTGLAGEGGTISWDGSNLIGSNIPIGGVVISGAPTSNGVFTVSGTAAGSGGGTYGTLDFNTAENVITISGCIPGLSVGLDANGVCTPIDLMGGTFTSFTGGSNGLQPEMVMTFSRSEEHTSELQSRRDLVC